MPFCKIHQTDKILQIPRRKKDRFRLFGIGRRASLSASRRGSMTLEASLLLPFFLCAVTALLYLFAFTSIQSREGRILTERAEALAVTAGQGNSGNPYIRLYDTRIVSLPFPWLSFGSELVTRKVVVRSWVGYTGEAFQDGDRGEIVYITPEGSVYHKDRDCSHLRLSVRQIASAGLEGERNSSGGRYTPCEYCVRKGQPGMTVYVTDYGTSYHNSRSCQGLKRTVMAVPLSQAGRPGCSRCSR